MVTRLLIFLTFTAGALSGAFGQSVSADKLVAAALELQNRSVQYDPAYRKLSYPMGDVPASVGVCSDVIIRAYRGVGIDLQQRVHEDMKANFSRYPKIWGLTRTDRNIDHRRVPNLRVYFARHGQELPVTQNAEDYKPGDIVTWNLNPEGFLPHIGIVTDQKSWFTEAPLIMHNMGGGQVVENMLFRFKITGHYRYAVE